MLEPPDYEYLTNAEQGARDAEAIVAFHNTLAEGGLDDALVNNATYQYAIHLYVATREHAARQHKARAAKES